MTRMSMGLGVRLARQCQPQRLGQRCVVLGQQDLRIEGQHAERGVAFRQMHGRVAALRTGRSSPGHRAR